MLSRAQQILLKRAQHQAAVSDEQYRDLLEIVSGARSSTDRRMSDEHVDKVLAFLERCYWTGVETGDLPGPSGHRNPVFRVKGYWAEKNCQGQTSRDRFAGRQRTGEIEGLEGRLAALGYGDGYCARIRRNTRRGDPGDDSRYLAALRRTLKSKLPSAA